MSSAADDDDVYPTGRIDNALGIRPMVLSMTLRFDDVLDAARLHAALCALLSMGDWRRLGGRLRKPSPANPSKTLEIHVPRVFTASRPPVAYSHEDLSDTPVTRHPLGRDLPAAAAVAALSHPSGHFRDFAAAPAFPDTIDGFVDRDDVPVLSLRVTSFQDATLVAIGAPHLLIDAMALGELLRAWSLVLAGRPDEVPPVLGARDDTLYDAADPARRPPEGEVEEPWALQRSYLAGFSFLLFLVRFLWGLLTERTIDAHAVFLPKHVLDGLRASALADIADSSSSGSSATTTTTAWVSEGDVLLAWGARVVARGQGRWPRPLNAINAVNMRGRLPETTPPAGGGGGGVYLRNFIGPSFMPVSVAEARGPLGVVAAKYRAALAAQTTPRQVLWPLRASRAAVDRGQAADVLCASPPTGELYVMTNWLKADIVGAADFAPAVLPRSGEDGQPGSGGGGGGGGGGRKQKHVPGRIVYVHAQQHAPSTLVRNTLGVMGKDQDGNVWMQGFFPPRTWDAMRKELDELNEKYAQ